MPFCIRKCPYCDFYSITDLGRLKSYVSAVIAEISMTATMPFWVDTIYFGGGTPSLLTPLQVESILETINKNFKVHPGAEITLEVNPGAIKEARFREYISSGVNRINIGVQSFLEKNLLFLGRIHTSRQAQEALVLAGDAGFKNIGLDLIYGLPGQDESQWLEDLKKATGFGLEHLSCYMLSLEPGTRLYKNHRKGKFSVLPDEKVKDLFEITMAFLEDNGYFHYEISNFAKIDRLNPNPSDIYKFQSRHNRKYWTGEPYLGFGPGAHSFFSPVRYWNLRSVAGYIETVTGGHLPLDDREILTEEQQMTEYIYLGLRTSAGIDTKKFDRQFSTNFDVMFSHVLENMFLQDFLVLSAHQIRLTRKGMVFLDTIAGEFIEAIRL